MSMFEVCAKCGHVGRNYYVEKTFAVRAENAKKAAEAVRWFPRVKHHHKDAIRYVTEIDSDRFDEILKVNQEDQYFVCQNVQEQRMYVEENIFSEESFDFTDKSEPADKRDFYSGKTKIRNPKRYINYYREDARVSVC